MIHHIKVIQEAMENIDLNDTMIHTDIIKAINDTAQDQLIAFRDTYHETWTDSETTHAIVLTANSHQAIFALEIDVHLETMNIHVLTHQYAKFHVLYVAAHNIHLQIANVLHH